jgi:hypothetical protein
MLPRLREGCYRCHVSVSATAHSNPPMPSVRCRSYGGYVRYGEMNLGDDIWHL